MNFNLQDVPRDFIFKLLEESGIPSTKANLQKLIEEGNDIFVELMEDQFYDAIAEAIGSVFQ